MRRGATIGGVGLRPSAVNRTPLPLAPSVMQRSVSQQYPRSTQQQQFLPVFSSAPTASPTNASVSEAVSVSEAASSNVDLGSSSVEELFKRQKVSQGEEEVDPLGQLRVAMARIRALEEEVLELRTEIMVKKVEETHSTKFGRELQTKEDLLEFKERELKEREEVLRTSTTISKDVLSALSSQSSQSGQVERMSSQDTLGYSHLDQQNSSAAEAPTKVTDSLEHHVASFLNMARAEFVVLFRHEVNSENRDLHDDASLATVPRVDAVGIHKDEKKAPRVDSRSFNGWSTPLSSTGRARSPENGQRPLSAFTPPSSPLSLVSTTSAHRSFFSTFTSDPEVIGFLSKPDKDLFSRMTELDAGCAVVADLLRSLERVLTKKEAVSELVMPLRGFIMPKSHQSVEVILSACRILYYAALRFVEVRKAVSEDSSLMDALLTRLEADDYSFVCLIEVPILRLFCALANGRIHRKEEISLRPLRSILHVNGPLAKRAQLNDRPVTKECALELLSLLMQEKTDVFPESFPSDEGTWDKVLSPFVPGDSMSVCRSIVFITQQGDHAIKFLLHHRLLSQLIDVMYAAECRQNPNRQALALLATVWRNLKTIELTDEEKHRLIASLLSLREIRGKGDTAQVVSRAEFILKTLGIVLT